MGVVGRLVEPGDRGLDEIDYGMVSFGEVICDSGSGRVKYVAYGGVGVSEIDEEQLDGKQVVVGGKAGGDSTDNGVEGDPADAASTCDARVACILIWGRGSSEGDSWGIEDGDWVTIYD